MNLLEVCRAVAHTQREKIQPNGSMPAGNNGLYNDPETPVRNTSHWVVTYSYLYERTGEEEFKQAAYQCLSYLQSDEARPYGETFHHRAIDGKDKCNGLIGQAWTIEALAVAARIFDDDGFASLAENVFLLHPHDNKSSLWKRVEIDGRVLPFDATFNHQLWFAAAGGLLSQCRSVSPAIKSQVVRFLDEVETNLRLYDSGLIFHPLLPPSIRRQLHLTRVDQRGRIGLTFITGRAPIPSRQRALRHKAIGYHAFNMYAFGLLKNVVPAHPLWESPFFNQLLQYIQSDSYKEIVWRNEFGSAHNPVGFEVAFVLASFEQSNSESQNWWIQRQIREHYNTKTAQFDTDTPDAEALTARIYEAVRLLST